MSYMRMICVSDDLSLCSQPVSLNTSMNFIQQSKFKYFKTFLHTQSDGQKTVNEPDCFVTLGWAYFAKDMCRL